MKKILALIMVLVLALAMSPAALAAEDSVINSAGGSQSGDVNVKVEDFTGADVFAVNITWGSLTFVFAPTGWDDGNLRYTGNWTTEKQTVTVKNNSNVAITATNTLDVTETNGTTASITGGATFDLEIGEYDKITITAEGNPTVEGATFKIGSVNVKIAKKS